MYRCHHTTVRKKKKISGMLDLLVADFIYEREAYRQKKKKNFLGYSSRAKITPM